MSEEEQPMDDRQIHHEIKFLRERLGKLEKEKEKRAKRKTVVLEDPRRENVQK